MDADNSYHRRLEDKLDDLKENVNKRLEKLENYKDDSKEDILNLNFGHNSLKEDFLEFKANCEITLASLKSTSDQINMFITSNRTTYKILGIIGSIFFSLGSLYIAYLALK